MEVEQIIYKIEKKDYETLLQQFVAGRYEGIVIDTQAAAQILEVSKSTINNHVKRGLLIPITREDRPENGKHYFRLSYILTVDKAELKLRQYKQ